MKYLRDTPNNPSLIPVRFVNYFFLIFIYYVAYLSWPWDGSSLNYDARQYIATALTLADTGKFDESFLFFPPLYPMVLSLMVPLESNLEIAASYVNAIIFLLLMPSYLFCFSNSQPSGPVTAMALFFVALSSSIYIVFFYAWSEPLFLLLTLYCLYFWSGYLAHRKKSYLYLSFVFLSLVVLTRHAGITVVVTILLSLLLYPSSSRLKELMRVFIVGSIAAVPYILWIVRTWIVSGTATGPRVTLPYRHFVDVFQSYSRVIAHWWFPHSYFTDSNLIAAIITIVVILLVVYLTHGELKKLKASAETANSEVDTFSALFFVCGIFILFYSPFLIVSATMLNINLPNDRLASPLIFPLSFVLFTGFSQRLLSHHNNNKHIRAFIVLSGCIWFFVWLSAPNMLVDLLLEKFAY